MNASRSVLSFLSAVLVTSCLDAVTAEAHGIHHSVAEGEAVVVSLSYGDGSGFSDQRYEIYRPGEESPFQVGRTDGLGRIAFVPDCDGQWRVRAFSEDGHGLDIEVWTTGRGLAGDARGVGYGGNSRIILGAAIIIAAFGSISLFLSRKRR